jgi:hypothetical protein
VEDRDTPTTYVAVGSRRVLGAAAFQRKSSWHALSLKLRAIANLDGLVARHDMPVQNRCPLPLFP